MNQEQYNKSRNEMMAAVEGFMAEGKLEESNAKMKEIEDLDNKWDATKLANANLSALKDKNKVTDIANNGVFVEGGQQVDSTKQNETLTEASVYEAAWSKQMMGQKIDGNELEVFNKVNKQFDNAYTHDTGNSGVLIPETVVAGIWSRAEEMYPLFRDAKKFNVRGTLKIAKHNSIDAGDADWYAEGTIVADEQNTFGEMILDGHELAKAVTVSWKLKAMAVQEFIPYITNELGERVGVALGTAAARGNGTSQPEGVETALKAEASTPQVSIGAASYANITGLISKLHSSYLNGAKFYVNNASIYGEGGLINVLDGNGRPYFTEDAMGQYSGRMFGFPVEADAGVSPGSIVFGNANKGLVFNTNEPFSVVTEDHAKARTTDYVAYAVVDGGVLDTKAFSLLEPAPAV